MKAGYIGAIVFALSAGCGATHVPRPSTPAPRVRDANDAIPGDLDVALRVDLSKIRSVLGEDAFLALEKRSPTAGAGGDAVTERLLGDAVRHADTALIAFRPASSAELVDSVLVLRGHFESIDPKSDKASPWQSAQDLGGGWRRYDREKQGPRAAPARIYARGDDLMVFASSAELDSVERRLETGADDPHVEPAEQGVISLDARAHALFRYVEDRAPRVARLMQSAERLRMHADLDSTGLTGELDLALSTESDAKATASAAEDLLKAASGAPGLLGRAVSGVKVEAVKSRLVVHVSLSTRVLVEIGTCVNGGSCE